MNNLKLKFKRLHPDAIMPKYQTDGSAGFDFHSLEDALIAPGMTKILRSGWAMEIPKGYVMTCRQRSGMSIEYRNYLAISSGTVDSDYRGEILFPITNHQHGGQTPQSLLVIRKGDRIIQGIITRVYQFEMVEVDELSDTKRGTGGWGHTGKE